MTTLQVTVIIVVEGALFFCSGLLIGMAIKLGPPSRNVCARCLGKRRYGWLDHARRNAGPSPDRPREIQE